MRNEVGSRVEIIVEGARETREKERKKKKNKQNNANGALEIHNRTHAYVRYIVYLGTHCRIHGSTFLLYSGRREGKKNGEKKRASAGPFKARLSWAITRIRAYTKRASLERPESELAGFTLSLSLGLSFFFLLVFLFFFFFVCAGAGVGRGKCFWEKRDAFVIDFFLSYGVGY